MKKFVFRVSNAYRRHGLREFLRLSVVNVMYHIRARFGSMHGKTAEDDFDRLYGTETNEIREIGSLDVQSQNSWAAVRYQPTSANIIRDFLDRLEADLDFPQFTFIDFGSGKGRVLIVAGEYPFVEIIGVEFSRELNEIAAANIGKLSLDVTRQNRIRLVCTDAAMFQLPRSHLVCYFYNPFGEFVMAQVAEQLAVHSKELGYRVIVIYVEPRHLGAFQSTGAFITMAETENATILTTRKSSARG